jgi:hypothetical protein
LQLGWYALVCLWCCCNITFNCDTMEFKNSEPLSEINVETEPYFKKMFAHKNLATDGAVPSGDDCKIKNFVSESTATKTYLCVDPGMLTGPILSMCTFENGRSPGETGIKGGIMLTVLLLKIWH